MRAIVLRKEMASLWFKRECGEEGLATLLTVQLIVQLSLLAFQQVLLHIINKYVYILLRRDIQSEL